MTTLASAASAASSPIDRLQASLGTVTIEGVTLNVTALALLVLVLGVLFMFWRIQRSEKLDFADMITKNGRAVSLTKVLQLIGGLTSTWIMIKLTLTNSLTEPLFGLYLTYVGAIEGYSKFVAAKYGYDETAVKDARGPVSRRRPLGGPTGPAAPTGPTQP